MGRYTFSKNKNRDNINTPLAPTKFLTLLACSRLNFVVVLRFAQAGTILNEVKNLARRASTLPQLLFFASVFMAVILFYSHACAFTASYEQTISGTGLSEAQTSSVKIKDDKMRIETNSPEGRVINIMDGKTVYSYFPSRNKAMKFVVQGTPKMETLSNYGAYLRSLDALLVGSERIGEYDCDIFELIDPRTQMLSKIWLWKKKEFPVRVETKVPDGVVTTIIENLKIGIDIDDSEFMLPPGVEITEMQ